MSLLKITEAISAQWPMVRHAAEIGWESLSSAEAEEMRGGETGAFLYAVLREKLIALNPALVTEENAQDVIDRLEAVSPTIEGNKQFLHWLRGERQIPNEAEGRDDYVRLIDFDNIEANVFHVSWEWQVRTSATGRKANRADVMFLINGIPVCIVEHKNPKLRDAIDRAVKQLKRYEMETPELIASAQVFNATHLIDYWYGVTWNASRRFVARWKQTPEETYRFAVQSFFDRAAFLRMLEEWILFYTDEEGELRKSVLRQHQVEAVHAVMERCADPKRKRGLIWHTQGSGKTFTLLTSARMMLEDRDRFGGATVLLIVDRTELEGQLKSWVDRILGEMTGEGIAVWRANSRQELQELLKSDKRGLIISMIHKFDDIKKDSRVGENVYVLIDEAHRSVGRDLGTYLMSALPNATLIGFTGTPIDKTAHGGGTFKIFGADDPGGYLHKYGIVDSIRDETTLPIKHTFAPSELLAPVELLDKEFLSLAEAEGISDVEELDSVLKKAVNLRAFLTADDRIEKVAAFVAEHFKESVLPRGYKAFLVGVNREACAKYKQALDRHLPSEWSAPVYTASAADVVDRPLVAQLQLSEDAETDVRKKFKKADQDPKILIVTDKLLTGFDAPLLYTMYLDKPMRDHVLLQALARVNRPYVDANGIQKKVGLVVDFVGVLKELKKALKFDSTDVEGAIQDLDKLMGDFKEKMASKASGYLEVGDIRAGDAALEKALAQFVDPEARQEFYDFFRDVEGLYEILSPDAELRDNLELFKRLAELYAVVRNQFDGKSLGPLGELEYKTRRLVQQNAQSHGLGGVLRTVTFDLKTLEAIAAQPGDDKGKVVNFVRSVVADADQNGQAAPFLVPLKERAENVLKSLEERSVSTAIAMELLRDIAKDKDAAEAERQKLGLSPKAFAAYWRVKDEDGVTPDQAIAIAKEADKLMAQFPHFAENPEERRQLRAELYRPLMGVGKDARARIVDAVLQTLVGDDGD